MRDRKANFSVMVIKKDHVIIRDIGPWDRYMTVTNDAEGVVETLFLSGDLKSGQRLFYYDTENALDELLIENGRFAGFAFGGPR